MAAERQDIEDAIRSTPNLAAAAHKLGVARKTLHNRMRALGMPRHKGGRPKVAFGRKRRAWATGGLVAAGVVGAVLLARGRGTKT